MLKLLFIFTALFVSSLSPQSLVDSLKIYSPFTNQNDIRRILLTHFSILGDEDKSLINKYSEAIATAKKSNASRDEAEALVKLAEIFFKAGLYTQALENYFEALKKYEAENDSIMTGIVETKIGRTYYFADISSSVDYSRKGYNAIKHSDDFEIKAYAAYIGATLEKDGKKAHELFKKALAIQLEIIKNKPDNYEVNVNLSRYYNTTGNEEAALRVAEKIRDNWLIILYLNNIGYKKVNDGKYNEAVKYFHRSLDICLSRKYKTLLRNTYENLARAYQKMGKWQKSAYYHNLMHFVEESLFSEEFVLQASESRIKYETEKKELENEFLKKEKLVLTENINLGKYQNFLLLLSFAGASFTSIFIYLSRRKMKVINKNLDEKNEKLAAVIEELKVSENNLKNAQETAKLANWEWDVKNNVITFSEQLPLIYGLDEAHLKLNFKESILKNIHPEDRAKLINEHNDNHNQQSEQHDYRIIKHGKIYWVKANRVYLRNDSGEVTKIRGTVQDITEAKEEEEIKLQIAAQMSFTRQLLESQETERKRIAGELHDSLGQNLLVISNQLLVKMQQPHIEGGSLSDTAELVSRTIEEVRSISHNLHPHLLDQLGITKTIKALTTQLVETTNISISAEIDNIDETLEITAEINLFRIIQESFNNIIKHSGASKAEIIVKKLPKLLFISIKDNGKGMIEDQKNRGDTLGYGFGLYGMKKRAHVFDWVYEIDSKPGMGTEVKITIPLLKAE